MHLRFWLIFEKALEKNSQFINKNAKSYRYTFYIIIIELAYAIVLITDSDFYANVLIHIL